MPAAPAVALRRIWRAVCLAGAATVVVSGGLAATQPPPMPEYAAGAFYAVAALATAALLGAFWLAHQMEARLSRAGSSAEAERTVQTLGLSALAAAYVPTLAASVATFLTGDVLTLAQGMPLFLFAWLTWPSDGRVGYWLALRRRG